MERRRFLACFGGVGALPALWAGTPTIERPVQIRYWLSPKAASVAAHDRLPEYVQTALEPVVPRVDISYGGIVPVSVEHGSEVMLSGEWPLRMVVGNRSQNGPVRDSNIILTDGPLGPDPPGFARGAFASVGGARHLDAIPSRSSLDDIVPYNPTMYTIQLFIHELGHTLGLTHEHGSVKPTSGGHVASPMVSGYAWRPPSEQFAADHSHCGDPYPRPVTGDRYLSLSFSECARNELRSSL